MNDHTGTTSATKENGGSLSNDPLTIDIVSDVMCPWCFIGQKNLETAKALAGEVPVSIRWRPYQLDPTLPPEGKDRQTYLNEKFGGEDRAGTIYQRVKDAGSASGIDFRFDLMKVSPNTLDAHRLIRWAGGVSADTQDRLVKRLFEMFFVEGKNIGDHAVLTDAAKSVGMDDQIISDLLSADDDKLAVQQEIADAQKMGVTGVPFFIVAGKYGISGAQPPEVLANAIRQISAEMWDDAAYSNSSQPEN